MELNPDKLCVIVLYGLMSRQCEITKKRIQVGGRYSSRTRATQFNPCGKVNRRPNLQKKRVYVPELGRRICVCVSARGLRVMAKKGIYATLKKANLI